MTLGAEPKKVAILAVLLVAAGYLMYSNVFSGEGEETASASTASEAFPALPIPGSDDGEGTPNAGGGLSAANASLNAAVADGPGALTNDTAAIARARRGGTSGEASEEFRPSLKPREGAKLDPARIDPTLELYRLDKLKLAAVAAGGRNLFEFSAAAPPPPLPGDIKVPVKPVKRVGPDYVPPPPPEPPKPPQTQAFKPQPPPVQYKYYGFHQKDFEMRSKSGGLRRGLFLLDGEKIFIVAQGEIMDNTYKIVSLEAGQATVEHIRFPQQPQQVRIEQSPDGPRE